ncbi:right-handed parallel beta-helix repeat-containing protein [Labilibaculum sp. DW002]|uniref:Right-handed parallel beta-helix repeat-containing protein n=1 Tax=Paralabilibaculum antarcticum TaxID=2912572 RepID=A0ABT5VPP2_9BACT|nr:right-handed parallel beta-helix repeat-containing protein [Labilibaculum sp. DW002]MDE5416742.1 right-handed parallel beta-helix repeat-containing protein [Labilibaculum sp. DW002]
MRISIQIILLVLLIVSGSEIMAETYYVNAKTGNDANSGAQIHSPFKSLNSLGSLKLSQGDSLLLASDCTFYGSLELKNVHGNQQKPIVITSYQSGNDINDHKAEIDAKGCLNGILLENCSFIELENIKITANGGFSSPYRKQKKQMRCGVLVKLSKSGNYKHIYLNNLLVVDVFYEEKGFVRGAKEVKTANGSQNYGWGIRFITAIDGAFVEDIKIEDCLVKNVAHTGIKFTGNSINYSLRNISIQNNKVLETGGPGIQMSGVKNVIVRNNKVNRSGSHDDTRKWGRGSGLWTWGSKDILIEKNHFLNAKGPGDSAGAHIDYNCNNVVLQYNFTANNAGGFCEILGNNYNCAYRYNISVNDGYRIKGKNGAFQEGKLFWLSGYNGKRKRRGPYNSYFYNNTMYVKQDILTKIAIDKAASGVLIANNIFFIEGKSKAVLGDQYNPEKEGETTIKNLIFQNNLFLRNNNWPKELPIQDDRAIIGNPDFANVGGDKIVDYMPLNSNLIKNKGIEIHKIPSDSIGLSIGLQLKHDILGNRIEGLPDMGAIELK